MRLVTKLPPAAVSPFSAVVDGDSITWGALTPAGFRYSDVAQHYFRPDFGVLTNIAISGEQFVTMLGNIETAVYPLIDAALAAGQKSICFCAGGTNDIGLSGTGPEALFDIASQYYQACKARGAEYCVGWTILPRGGTTTMLSSIATYNNILRARYASAGIDLLIDAAVDPQLTGPGNPPSPDGLHWNLFGQDILANHFTPGILSLYGNRLELDAIDVASGPLAGGTTVNIFGGGFRAGVANVSLAGMTAASFEVISDTHIQAVSKAAFCTGIGEVAIMGPGGGDRLVRAFSYT